MKGLSPPAKVLYGQVGFHFHSGLAGPTFEERLAASLNDFHLDALIAGLPGPAGRWDICKQEAKQREIPIYLWHPVLSGLDLPDECAVLGLSGDRGGSYELKEAPNHFRFYCPNNPAVRQLTRDLLESAIEQLQPDGIFFDKIRWPSPAAGAHALLCCFCEYCHDEAYAAGLDLDEVKVALAEAVRQPLDSKLFSHFIFDTPALRDPVLFRWQRFRARAVTQLMAVLTGLARSRGCKVGLDLFAPVLSPAVGQDYRALAPLADWIKPMLYCQSVVPSGFPIELHNLLEMASPQVRATTRDWLGCDIPDGPAILRDGVPQELAVSQAEVSQLLTGCIPSFAGIELAYRPGICSINPIGARRYGELLAQSPLPGVVASPDIILPSADNRNAFVDAFRRGY